jgi:hypothetical protein
MQTQCFVYDFTSTQPGLYRCWVLSGAVRGVLVRLAAGFAVFTAPPADGPARDIELLGNDAVGRTLTHERDRLSSNRRAVLFHVATL